MKLWVIMFNDYPEGATTAGVDAAKAACERMKQARVTRLTRELGKPPEEIDEGYWRVYEFEDCATDGEATQHERDLAELRRTTW